MPVLKKYPPELKADAVQLVVETRGCSRCGRGACARSGQQLGIQSDTLRGWVKLAEIDAGARLDSTTDDATHLPRARGKRATVGEHEPSQHLGSLGDEARPPTQQMIAVIDGEKDQFGVDPTTRNCRATRQFTTKPGIVRL